MCVFCSLIVFPAPHNLFAHTLTHAKHRQWTRPTYAIVGVTVGPQSCGGNCERGRESQVTPNLLAQFVMALKIQRENRAVSTNSITAQLPTLASVLVMPIVVKVQWLCLSVAGCPLRLPPTLLDEEYSLLYSVAHLLCCQDLDLY